jgi:hypothetical protein
MMPVLGLEEAAVVFFQKAQRSSRMLNHGRLGSEIQSIAEGGIEARQVGLGEPLGSPFDSILTVRAYLLKEAFHSFWGYTSPGWAGRFLDRWTTDALRSRIEPFARLARTLRQHRPQLLNWFWARHAFARVPSRASTTKPA